MTAVGVRELKAKLSYYLQLMQAGEEIAIMVRNHVVGYLSRSQHTPSVRRTQSILKEKKIDDLFKKWEEEGYLRRRARAAGQLQPFTPIPMKEGPNTTEMIRALRDDGL